MIHRWGWWYTAGYCHLRNAIRTFRVDRIVEITLLGAMFDEPTDFDVQAYLAAEPYARPGVRVRMRFRPEGALIAMDDRSYWETLEPEPDGSLVVTFAAPDLEWATSTALVYGGLAVVLEPTELRRLVVERAQAIAASHNKAEAEVN